MFKKALIAAAAVAAMTAATAADFKVGVVNPGRILSESAPAVAAQNKLKSYFKSREDELSRRIRTFKDKAAKFEKDSAVMTETQRLNKRRDLAEEEREISRMQRALLEERNQRSQEESQIILSRANRIIQDIPELRPDSAGSRVGESQGRPHRTGDQAPECADEVSPRSG